EVFACAVEFEARMQPSAGDGGTAVLPRSEDNKEAAGTKDVLREGPAVWNRRSVGERPTFEIHRCRASVVDLDPVFGVTIFILQSVRIGGDAFRDADVCAGDKPRQKDKKHQETGADTKHRITSETAVDGELAVTRSSRGDT